MPNYTITPIPLGFLTVSGAVLQSCRRFFDTLQSACMAFLIQGSSHTFLVDSGPSRDIAWGEKYHRKMERHPEQDLLHGLSALGVSPEAIDATILTHLHWDHVYGLDQLSCPVIVQKKEVEYSKNPLPRDARAYEADLGSPAFAAFWDRLTVLDGDTEIAPGVSVMLTPGHTPGSQTVLVDTAKGVHALAGDTFNLYDSLTFNPAWPPGIFQNLADFYASEKKIRECSDVIIPGHDPLVLGRRFPEAC